MIHRTHIVTLLLLLSSNRPVIVLCLILGLGVVEGGRLVPRLVNNAVLNPWQVLCTNLSKVLWNQQDRVRYIFM